jgi:hypothetical protein
MEGRLPGDTTTLTYDETPADITGGSFGPNVIAISPDGTTRTSAGTAKTP